VSINGKDRITSSGTEGGYGRGDWSRLEKKTVTEFLEEHVIGVAWKIVPDKGCLDRGGQYGSEEKNLDLQTHAPTKIHRLTHRTPPFEKR